MTFPSREASSLIGLSWDIAWSGRSQTVLGIRVLVGLSGEAIPLPNPARTATEANRRWVHGLLWLSPPTTNEKWGSGDAGFLEQRRLVMRGYLARIGDD